MSVDSTDSREPVFVAAIDIRRRLSESINGPKTKSGFKRDPEDPSASVLKEPWEDKGMKEITPLLNLFHFIINDFFKSSPALMLLLFLMI